MATQESTQPDTLKLQELLYKASGICSAIMSNNDLELHVQNAAWAAHDLIEEAISMSGNGGGFLRDPERESAAQAG